MSSVPSRTYHTHILWQAAHCLCEWKKKQKTNVYIHLTYKYNNILYKSRINWSRSTLFCPYCIVD